MLKHPTNRSRKLHSPSCPLLSSLFNCQLPAGCSFTTWRVSSSQPVNNGARVYVFLAGMSHWPHISFQLEKDDVSSCRNHRVTFREMQPPIVRAFPPSTRGFAKHSRGRALAPLFRWNRSGGHVCSHRWMVSVSSQTVFFFFCCVQPSPPYLKSTNPSTYTFRNSCSINPFCATREGCKMDESQTGGKKATHTHTHPT